MKLSVPGKTFLVGEYLALSGGPSLLLATGPRFELEVTQGTGDQNPWHPHSPAGFLWNREREKLKSVQFAFHDPHHGLGGLGASSAQWALLYAYLQRDNLAALQDLESTLRLYRVCAWNGQGQPPSGHDVVAQLKGELTEFDGKTYEARSLFWNFRGLSFTLIRTGAKLATHEHLKAQMPVPRERLRALIQDAKRAVQVQDADALCLAVDGYGLALAEAGLLAEHTAGLITSLRELDVKNGWGVRAVKGCGAMGADVILVIHDTATRDAIEAWANQSDLLICGTERDLMPGLNIDGRTVL